jgi:hypothetical protein
VVRAPSQNKWRTIAEILSSTHGRQRQKPSQLIITSSVQTLKLRSVLVPREVNVLGTQTQIAALRALCVVNRDH